MERLSKSSPALPSSLAFLLRLMTRDTQGLPTYSWDVGPHSWNL